MKGSRNNHPVADHIKLKLATCSRSMIAGAIVGAIMFSGAGLFLGVSLKGAFIGFFVFFAIWLAFLAGPVLLALLILAKLCRPLTALGSLVLGIAVALTAFSIIMLISRPDFSNPWFWDFYGPLLFGISSVVGVVVGFSILLLERADTRTSERKARATAKI